MSKILGQISFFFKKKDYKEFELQHNKQSVEDILIQKAIKRTTQIIYDKGLFDNYANVDKILEDFLLTTRRRGDLSEQVIDVIQRFY